MMNADTRPLRETAIERINQFPVETEIPGYVIKSDTRPLREIAIERVARFIQETGTPGYTIGIRAHAGVKFWDRLVRGELQHLSSIEKVEAWMAKERARRLADRPRIVALLEKDVVESPEVIGTSQLEDFARGLGTEDWYRGILENPFQDDRLWQAWEDGHHRMVEVIRELRGVDA